jgi:acyl carrier protein
VRLFRFNSTPKSMDALLKVFDQLRSETPRLLGQRFADLINVVGGIAAHVRHDGTTLPAPQQAIVDDVADLVITGAKLVGTAYPKLSDEVRLKMLENAIKSKLGIALAVANEIDEGLRHGRVVSAPPVFPEAKKEVTAPAAPLPDPSYAVPNNGLWVWPFGKDGERTAKVEEAAAVVDHNALFAEREKLQKEAEEKAKNEHIQKVYQSAAEALGPDLALRIDRVIGDQLGHPTNAVLLNSHLVADLGADSLDEVELTMAIEDEFNIELDDDKVQHIKTVGDIYVLLAKILTQPVKKSSLAELVGFKKAEPAASGWTPQNPCLQPLVQKPAVCT